MSKIQFTGTATQPQCNRKFCQFNKDQYCTTFYDTLRRSDSERVKLSARISEISIPSSIKALVKRLCGTRELHCYQSNCTSVYAWAATLKADVHECDHPLHAAISCNSSRLLFWSIYNRSPSARNLGTVLVLSKLKTINATALQPQRSALLKYVALFKNVAHSLEPGETPSYSASHQSPNYVQRS